jgi:hypothetical protein
MKSGSAFVLDLSQEEEERSPIGARLLALDSSLILIMLY